MVNKETQVSEHSLEVYISSFGYLVIDTFSLFYTILALEFSLAEMWAELVCHFLERCE